MSCSPQFVRGCMPKLNVLCRKFREGHRRKELMGRFCSDCYISWANLLLFFLLGKTNSYHSNSFSLPIVPYTFLSHLVMSSSCSSGLNFDGQIVSNRGLFQSHCQSFSMEFSKNTHSRSVPRLKRNMGRILKNTP